MNHGGFRARAAFTLLELLVVLMLLAITAAAAVPAFLSDRSDSAERGVATSLATALMRVRDGARASGAPATLILAPADGRMWLVWRDSTVVEQLIFARGVKLAAQSSARLECRFTASGSATPFAVTIQGSHPLAVSVDGWSGEITIGDGSST
jgi:prepilin-type N-terminal cleavage/methylation domain-containing protein